MPLPPTDATADDRAAVASAGLCAGCRHLQVLRSRRSTFVRCALSDSDPRFDRYPRLPVVACDGFVPAGGCSVTRG